jgi:diguanylate cyclase (GGDEF)-like protein
MSVIPILALLYLIFSGVIALNTLGPVLGAVIVLSTLGLFLMKRIIDPIIRICSDAKVIANGELSRKINITRDDEIGELSSALNQMTQHIKSNMDELKIYGERTKGINLQISNQVIALSGLLEISNIISEGTLLSDVFDIAISRLSQIASSSFAFIASKDNVSFEVPAHYGLRADILAALRLPINVYILNPLLDPEAHFLLDSSVSDEESRELLKLFSAKNLLVYPIVVQGRPYGILGIGNPLDGFRYTQDDIELMSIFAKQLSIAVENDLLSKKVKDLEILDEVTGLYNRRYIFERLDEEILRAISHQRPCALLVFKINNFTDLKSQLGELTAEDILKKSAVALTSSVGDIDRAGRIEDNIFGIVLPEKNKRQAQEFGLKLKSAIEDSFKGESDAKKPRVGISILENPIDGSDAASLFEKITTAQELIV